MTFLTGEVIWQTCIWIFDMSMLAFTHFKCFNHEVLHLSVKMEPYSIEWLLEV